MAGRHQVCDKQKSDNCAWLDGHGPFTGKTKTDKPAIKKNEKLIHHCSLENSMLLIILLILKLKQWHLL
jgi:hypothetical protein